MFREATLALALICSPASHGVWDGMCTIPEDVYRSDTCPVINHVVEKSCLGSPWGRGAMSSLI